MRSFPAKGVRGDRSAMLVPMTGVCRSGPLQQIVVNHVGSCNAVLPVGRAIGASYPPLDDSGAVCPIAVGLSANATCTGFASSSIASHG